MNIMTMSYRRIARLTVLVTALIAWLPAHAGMLVEHSSAYYGSYGGLDYLVHTGRFAGTTANGSYRVPFEIVAPADSALGNGTVVVEPPHFLLGTHGRDAALGPALIFDRGYAYATVGFANQGGNMLDAAATDVVIAGIPTTEGAFPFPRDVEILKQFAEALTSDIAAMEILGDVERLYAYGISQTAAAIYELVYGPGADDLFDLTVLHVPLWRPAFERPDVLAVLPEIFEPLDNVGKVLLVSAEGDLLTSQSIQLRNAVLHPEYRLYEVAGAPHLAQDFTIGDIRTNPLDVAPIVRAAFVAGDHWVRDGRPAPASSLLAAAESGAIDPVYGFPTGIARDADLNALGGVRFPDVAIGRAFHLAAYYPIEVLPGAPGLVGLWFDLACNPLAGANSARPRFSNHGNYVSQFVRQANHLLSMGLLLEADREALVEEAAESTVGRPRSCTAP